MNINPSVANLDAIFEHVKGALRNLDENRPEIARKNLEQIWGSLAVLALQNTDADPGSPHWMQLVEAVQQAFPPDENWKDYTS